MRLGIGILGIVLGALFVVEGYVRLGIGRHGEAWWKPFTNAPTLGHFENLVSLGLGVVGIVFGVWVVVSALRRG